MSTRTRLLCQTAILLAGITLWSSAGYARDNLAAAQAAIKAGDLRTAVIDLRNAVRDDPQNAAARFELAQVELQLADPVAAERDVRAAEQRGYDVRKTTALLGAALLAQNRPDALLAQLQPKGQDKELDAEIQMLRGEAQARLGKLNEAQASLHQAEALDPNALGPWVADARLAMAKGDLKTAMDRVDRALSVQPEAVEAIVLKAGLLRQKGDTAGAKALLDKVIAETPPAIPARVERASLLIGQGKVAEAKADVDAVLKLTPNNPQALFLRAVILHEDGDDNDAQALLQKLEPIFPAFPRAYLLRATVQEKLGELHQAEESAAKYIARVPGDVNGYKLLAQLYIKDGRPDQAITPLKQAVEAGKADAAVYDMLARSYAAVGQSAAAADAFAKAGQLAPGNVGVEAAEASSLIRSGQPDKALTVLQQALAKAPDDRGLQNAVVGAALATGDIGKAESVLTKIKASTGDTPATQNLTAMLQLARLDAPAAEATIASVVKNNPDFMPAQITLVRALVMQGKSKEAEDALTAILNKDPASEPALGLLVEQRLRTKRDADAVSLMERAHAAKPTDVAITVQLGELYIRTGAPQKALDLAKAAQPTSGPANQQLLVLQANAQLALKDTQGARDTLSKVVALEPRSFQVRRELAAVDVQAKDYEAARNVIKEGMRATPRLYALDLDYALIDLKASGLQAALATADQLRVGDAGFQDLNALKGDIYMAADKPDDAIKAYRDAAQTAPSNLLTDRLAAAYLRTGKADEARSVLAAWIGEHPDDLSATATLSGLNITAGNLDAAETELKTILAAEPRNAVALNNLAWLYQLRGDARALPMAKEAYLLAPSPQSADTLGWILTRTGDPARGLVLLRQAAASGDPRIAYHFGVALNDVGKKDDAVKVLNAVVAVKGDFTEKADAQKLLGQLTKGS